MRLTPASRARRRLVGALAVLLLLSACAAQPRLGMEAPGRPALIWSAPGGDSQERTANAEPESVERQLLAAVDERERQGTDDLALATALYDLAILRRRQGKLAEAERLYRRSLDIRERLEGPDHPDVAATLNNLASVLVARGDYQGAEPLLRRTLRIRRTALGADHALTAQSLNNLALLHAAQGDAAAAEPLYRQAVAILEGKNGAAAPEDLARVLDNYAALLHDTGRATEAEALEARARGMRTRE
jgi:tetratricopeptide (TPR) repeat protein